MHRGAGVGQIESELRRRKGPNDDELSGDEGEVSATTASEQHNDYRETGGSVWLWAQRFEYIASGTLYRGA